MPINLDHAATTPLLPAARDAMVAALGGWANPSSPHAAGRHAKAMLEDARRRVAAALGWRGTVIFTGSASEALALAIGAAKRSRCLASATEHDAVLRHVGEASRLPVNDGGVVRWLEADLGDALVAVQSVNSETGVLQPVGELTADVRAAGGLVLSDCAQSAGKRPLPDADMIVVSAHKLGGPVGAAALLVSDPGDLAPSGGQELGYRAGTENVPAIMGFAAALEADRGWLMDAEALRARLDAAILDMGGQVVAATAPRIATIASYRMPGVSARAQLIRFDAAGIAVSAGSACSSGSLRTSHVLSAMGWDDAAAGEVIRVSFGWSTTGQDVDSFIDQWRRLAQG